MTTTETTPTAHDPVRTPYYWTAPNGVQVPVWRVGCRACNTSTDMLTSEREAQTWRLGHDAARWATEDRVVDVHAELLRVEHEHREAGRTEAGDAIASAIRIVTEHTGVTVW